MIKVAQIGLGRWGLQRAWAWHDVGVDLTVFDASMPSAHRIPPHATAARSLQEAVKDAQIIAVSTPPGTVLEVVQAAEVRWPEQSLFVEKPGATTHDEIKRLLELSAGRVTMGFTTAYDAGLTYSINDILMKGRGKRISLRSARLHTAGLHGGITVVEDLTIHDLVICARLGMFDDEYLIDVSGHAPWDVKVKVITPKATAIIDSSVRHAGRVRNIQLENEDISWQVVPDEYALCSDGRAIPPAQARPVYVECQRLVASAQMKVGDTAFGEFHGYERQIRDVWGAIQRIRDKWGT